MAGKVEAVLAGKKSSFPEDMEEHAMAAAATASPAAIVFAFFLAPPLSLLRHVAGLCAGYLGLDGGGLKPPAPAPASAAASEDDCTEVDQVVLEVRSRGGGAKPSINRPTKPRGLPVPSGKGGIGGETSA